MNVAKLVEFGKLNAKRLRDRDSLLLVVTLAILIIVLVITVPAFAMTQVSSDRPHIEKYLVESNGSEHIYGFKLCAGDEPLHHAKIAISSDSDYVIINTDKIVPKESCKIFSVGVTAYNVDSISAKIIEPVRV